MVSNDLPFARFTGELLQVNRDGSVKIALDIAASEFGSPGSYRPGLGGRTYSTEEWLAELDELVGAAVFLASDAARFVSGATLRVDGGYLASGI